MLELLIDLKIHPNRVPICFDVFIFTCFRRALSGVRGRCSGITELSIPSISLGIAGQRWFSVHSGHIMLWRPKVIFYVNEQRY